MWLYRTSGDTDKLIVLYEYQPGRGAKHPKAFLEGYKGYLHTDGYAVYHGLPEGITEEQRIGEGVQPELLFDKSGQAVNPKPEVCAAAGDYDPVCTGEICQHDFRTRSTVSTIAASAPE